MTSSYISVRTVLYDFAPSPDVGGDGLAVTKGQILLLLDNSHQDWWEFKIKTDRLQDDGGSGFVPRTYTQEAKFISSATACRDFIAEVNGDLTITDHENLWVYCVEADWALVKGTHAVGYVPRACITLEEEMDRAIALLDFRASEPGELSLKQGESLVILDRKYENWWRCKNASHLIGMAPCNHIKLRRTSSLSSLDIPISRSMSESTVVSLLVAHGCKDLTSSINHSSFSEYPVTHGGLSDVYRGQLLDGVTVAVKALRVPFNNFSEPPNHLKEAARELHTWGKCQHPNVLPLLGLVLFRGTIGMVSPWMGEGSLPGYLARTPGVNRYKLCSQICEGLAYLHKIGVIHGDLNGANILVSNEGVPLLSGFQNSQLINQTMAFTPTGKSWSGTIRWAAPELILESKPPDEASDVYALGMTIYEVMAGKIPYYGKSEVLVAHLVAVNKEPPERPETITNAYGYETGDKLWELLRHCCSFEPTARPSTGEVAEALTKIQTTSVLSREMAAQEVVSHLVAHGCQDLSDRLNLDSFSDYPVTHGGLSDIYRGQLADGTTVAVKLLRVSIDGITLGSKHLKHAARELHTWSKCRHPNIMPLLGMAVFRDRIGMVASWMKNGNLPKYLKVAQGVNRYDMCIQICEGLSYLHKIRIIHCDLKGANVLISDEGVPLLTDFGTSLVSDRTLHFTATTSGPSYTLRWSAAEILKETSPHTKASDVYALGMVRIFI